MKSTIRTLATAAIVMLALAANAPAVKANGDVAENYQTLENKQYGITPVDLVTRSYRGQLKKQGIPGYSQLIRDYKSRKIKAKDVVAAAVRANLLPQQALTDGRYLSTVNSQLRLLERRNETR